VKYGRVNLAANESSHPSRRSWNPSLGRNRPDSQAYGGNRRPSYFMAYYEFAGNYNFGPEDESCISTGALAELFCEVYGNGICWTTQGNKGPHEANFLKLDCSKAKAVLGWKPKWDIKTAVEKTVAFAKCKTDEEKLKCIVSQITPPFPIFQYSSFPCQKSQLV